MIEDAQITALPAALDRAGSSSHLSVALTPELFVQCEPKTLVSRLQYPFIETVTLDELDLGTFPMSVMGVKAYDTYGDDKVIMEVPVCWGSNCK